MKETTSLKNGVRAGALLRRAAFAVLSAAAFVSAASAADDVIVQRFDTAAGAANYTKWWGSAPTAISFDASKDAAGNAASGSMKVVVDFNLATYGGDNQFAIRGALGGDGNLNTTVVDASKYDHLEFDIYWDPASPQRSFGDFGGLDVGLVPTDYSQNWFKNFGVQIVDGWQHISLPVSDLTQTSLGSIGGVVFKMWSGASDWGQTGTATFWIDNVKLVPKGYVTGFDNDGYVSNNAFWSWWGGASRTVEFDPAHDAANDTNSGSIKVSVTFSGTGDNQYSEGMSLAGTNNYNGALTIHTASYGSFDFDLLIDPATDLDLSVLNTSGDPQGLGIGFATPTWGQTWPPAASQPKPVNDGAWHHVSIPLDPSWPDIPGLIFKKYFNNGPTGTLTFYVDNLRFVPTTAEIPPPTASIARAQKGLNLFYSNPGSQYQRQGIRSIAADAVSWIGNANPVTYSVTITHFPDGAAFPGAQAHIILVPDTAGGTAPDYSDPNAILFDIHADGNNGGTATFRYKVNQPNANGMMYGSGALGSVASTNILGKWSLTFQNDTDITLTSPDGSTTNLTMPAADAALFTPASAMGTYFGGQPNALANTGEELVFSNVKITNGSDTIVDESFEPADPDNGLSADNWIKRLDAPEGLYVIDNAQVKTPALWLRWSLPDADFQLKVSTNLNTAPIDAGLTPIISGKNRQVLLNSTNMVSANQAFYFLVKP